MMINIPYIVAKSLKTGLSPGFSHINARVSNRKIYIDFSEILAVAEGSTWDIFRYFLMHGGWILYLVVIAWGSYSIWLHKRQHAYMHHIKMMLLAIDVPKNTEQTLRAVESLFTALAGAHGSMTLWEKYYLGKGQENFSVEIVSLGGHIRFFIYTPAMYRDLVEAAVYAQYPDAEIEQVEDYTAAAPKIYPDPAYELWGTEMVSVKPYVYPLRTYKEFEDQLSGELKGLYRYRIGNLRIVYHIQGKTVIIIAIGFRGNIYK